MVGLSYVPGKGLPKVVLKGSGPLAEEILKQRGSAPLPTLIKNEALLQQLYRLPIDAEIGPELYQIVAIILVHVFAVEEMTRGENR